MKTWCPGNRFQLNERPFSLLFILIQVRKLSMFVSMLLILEREVIHGMILVKPTISHTLNDLLRIHVVLLIKDFDDGILNHQVLVLEVDEMRLSWLIVETKLASPQVPKFNSELGIDEDRCEQSLCSWWEEMFLLKLAAYNVCLSLLVGVSFKWQLGGKHGVESHTQAPNINQLRVVTLPLDDFRWSVRWCSTNSFSKFSEIRGTAEPKIYEFHIPILIEHDVLRLDVPVTQPALLEIK